MDSKKSARVSRTFEDSFSPQMSAIGLYAIGRSAERDFSPVVDSSGFFKSQADL